MKKSFIAKTFLLSGLVFGMATQAIAGEISDRVEKTKTL